jgi:hypothetical protein
VKDSIQIILCLSALPEHPFRKLFGLFSCWASYSTHQAITPRKMENTNMLRKISLAAVAALALTAAAVAPASAGGHGMHGGGHWGGGHWGHHHHGRFFGPSFYVGDSCYRTVFTKFGPRRVYVCDRVL